jgi:hypothetical protein
VAADKAKGWLGLLIGQSLWYDFFASAVDTPAKFMTQMDALVREVGERGSSSSSSSSSSMAAHAAGGGGGSSRAQGVSEGVPPGHPPPSACMMAMMVAGGQEQGATAQVARARTEAPPAATSTAPSAATPNVGWEEDGAAAAAAAFSPSMAPATPRLFEADAVGGGGGGGGLAGVSACVRQLMLEQREHDERLEQRLEAKLAAQREQLEAAAAASHARWSKPGTGGGRGQGVPRSQSFLALFHTATAPVVAVGSSQPLDSLRSLAVTLLC